MTGSPDRSCWWRLSRWWLLEGQMSDKHCQRRIVQTKGMAIAKWSQKGFSAVWWNLLKNHLGWVQSGYWRQNICSNSRRKWYTFEGMAVGMSQSKWIWERLQHGSNSLTTEVNKEGSGKLDWYSGSGLDSGVDGGARLRIREYRRRGKFWGRR